MEKFQNLIHGLADQFTSKSEKSKECIGILSAFTQNSSESVLSWFVGKAFPKGIRLIRLREAFIGAGFSFEENESLPEPLQKLAFLLAHGYVDIAADYEKFGFPSRDGMAMPLTTDRRPSPKRVQFIANAISQMIGDEALKHAMQSKRTRFSCLAALRTEPARTESITPTPEEMRAEINAINTFIKLNEPRLEAFLNGTVTEREEFRGLFKGDELMIASNAIFEFSSRVEGLCSERALQKYKKEKKNNER